jgi:hypothetical protein
VAPRVNAPGEAHTDMCERVHDLMVEASEAELWDLAAALSGAEEAAHVQCLWGVPA